MKRTTHIHNPRTAVIAGLAVLLTTAGGATAASLVTSAQIKDGTIREIDVQSTYRQALKPWFAKVDAAGSLLAGRHVTNVTRVGPGDFHVSFDRSVQRCAGVATVRGVAGNELYGFVTTYVPADKVIRVVLRDAAGKPTDGAGFNLVSSC